MSVRRDALMEELISLYLAEGFLSFGIGELASRLHCSRTTLYAIAPSKEQIVATAVRAFFRRSTERIETRLGAEVAPADRLRTYLEAISHELAPASPAFFADVDAFEPAREVYRQNTWIAARRVQELVRAVDAEGTRVGPSAAFLGAVAGQVMESINSGRMEAETGLDDSAAYGALADLLVAGIARA